MPRLKLSDGQVVEYDEPVSLARVVADLDRDGAVATLGARVNGELADLSAVIAEDAELRLVSAEGPEMDPDALYLVRHSCAHVMAEAIQKLVPEVKLVYGPPLDHGFYYDLAVPTETPLSVNHFEAIEAEMARIIAEDRPFTRYELPREEGLQKLEREGSKYKLDNAQRALEAGSTNLSWYATGEPGRDWEDLCRGPHVPRTGAIGAFKILSLASSYWHGDAKSDSLTRVYGTAFLDPEQLRAHLERLEEAKQRDHRILNKRLNLFHIDDMVGPGLILWKPAGATVRRELQEFIRGELVKQGYDVIYTPHIGKLDLYRTSGHFPYFQDSNYPPIIDQELLHALAEEGSSCAQLAHRIREGAIDGYLLKPMNCPHHIRLYASEPRSYRDLPVRLAEFGTVHRWEQSGELNGMLRVRGFTQDDAHLFCTEEQIPGELLGCLELVNIILTTLHLDDYRVRIGIRDPDGTKYAGDPASWDKAEAACREAVETLGVPYIEETGEAAFYGPKIDFVVRDVVGREWQLGTVQVDYSLPERFDLGYMGADNTAHRPVMIHRAPFGSMERFIGVLIEHFAGAFPTWLAPEQVRVLPISAKFVGYGEKVHHTLRQAGVRVGLDRGDERVQAKIKAASEAKIPYLLIVGGRDEVAGTVSVRKRGEGDQGAAGLEGFTEMIRDEIRERS